MKDLKKELQDDLDKMNDDKVSVCICSQCDLRHIMQTVFYPAVCRNCLRYIIE